jgi:DNA-binding FadR family transcriptional regulator
MKQQVPKRTEIKAINKNLKERGQNWLYQEVQSQIKAYIIDNSLKPGSLLPTETKLAELLGVSRNSVREAVKSLESLGIVRAKRGAGLIVSEFSFNMIFDNLIYDVLFGLKRIVDIAELRFHLEYSMAEEMIYETSQDQITALQDIVKSMQKNSTDLKWNVEDDREFHLALAKNLHNDVVRKILDIMSRTYHQARQADRFLRGTTGADFYERHHRIVKALEARDVAELKASIINHYIHRKFLGDGLDFSKLDSHTVRNYIDLTMQMFSKTVSKDTEKKAEEK